MIALIQRINWGPQDNVTKTAKKVAGKHCKQGKCPDTKDECLPTISSSKYSVEYKQGQCSGRVSTTISGTCSCKKRGSDFFSVLLPTDLYDKLVIKAEQEHKEISEMLESFLNKELC